MPRSRSFTGPRLGAYSLLFIVSAIAAVGSYLHFFVPFPRAIQIVDGAVTGALIPVWAIYTVALFRSRRKDLWKSENLLAVSVGGIITYLAYSRGYWFVWRELGRPEWMREQQVLPLTFLLVMIVIMYAALVSDKTGKVLPRTWLIGAAFLGAGIAGAASFVAAFT